jgi:hypothetical protein
LPSKQTVTGSNPVRRTIQFTIIMADYICDCEKKHEESKSGVSIKFGSDGAYHDIKCPCGKYMELKNPKSGAPSFRSNRYGQVY